MARRKYSVDEALIARYRKEGRGTVLALITCPGWK